VVGYEMISYTVTRARDVGIRWQIEVYKEDFNNERRDKERALAEKDSLMKQTTTLLNDLKALQERVSDRSMSL